MGDARLALRYVAGLPFDRWASRLSAGSADVRGRLLPIEVAVGGYTFSCPGGHAHLELLFVGGTRPQLAAVTLTCEVLLNGRSARTIRLIDGAVQVDGDTLPKLPVALESGAFVTGVLNHLCDVELLARGRPVRDATVPLPEGIDITLSDRDEVCVRAKTRGPPDDLVLARPLELQFGTHGIQIDHRSAPWLARIARVRVSGANLHPDGRVVLEGTGGRVMNRVVRTGLRTASAHLSGLVRRSPRFSRLRAFLRR